MSLSAFEAITITVATVIRLIPHVIHTFNLNTCDLDCRRLIKCLQGVNLDLERVRVLVEGPYRRDEYWPQLSPDMMSNVAIALQDIEALLQTHLREVSPFDHRSPSPSIKGRASDLHAQLKVRVDVVERVLQLPTIQPVFRHLASGTSNGRKYVCTLCPSSFSTSGHLARHSRKHTGERQHECPHPGCKTRTSRRDNLQSHYRIHMPAGQKRISGAKVRAAMEAARGDNFNARHPTY